MAIYNELSAPRLGLKDFFFFNHKEDSLFLPPSLCYSITPWTVACQAALSMGILQARILEWVAYSISRGSSQLRNQTGDSCIADRFFYQPNDQGSPSVASKIHKACIYNVSFSRPLQLMNSKDSQF